MLRAYRSRLALSKASKRIRKRIDQSLVFASTLAPRRREVCRHNLAKLPGFLWSLEISSARSHLVLTLWKSREHFRQAAPTIRRDFRIESYGSVTSLQTGKKRSITEYVNDNLSLFLLVCTFSLTLISLANTGFDFWLEYFRTPKISLSCPVNTCLVSQNRIKVPIVVNNKNDSVRLSIDFIEVRLMRTSAGPSSLRNVELPGRIGPLSGGEERRLQLTVDSLEPGTYRIQIHYRTASSSIGKDIEGYTQLSFRVRSRNTKIDKPIHVGASSQTLTFSTSIHVGRAQKEGLTCKAALSESSLILSRVKGVGIESSHAALGFARDVPQGSRLLWTMEPLEECQDVALAIEAHAPNMQLARESLGSIQQHFRISCESCEIRESCAAQD